MIPTGERPVGYFNKGVTMPTWLKTLLIAMLTAVVTILQSDSIQKATGIEKTALYKNVQIYR